MDIYPFVKFSEQSIKNPEPECFGHFGAGIPLLFTTIWGDLGGLVGINYKLPRHLPICQIFQQIGSKCANVIPEVRDH